MRETMGSVLQGKNTFRGDKALCAVEAPWAVKLHDLDLLARLQAAAGQLPYDVKYRMFF